MKKLILMLMLCAPMTMLAQKFGKVSTQSVMQAMPELAKANGEMAAEQKRYENDLKAMQDELTRKSQEYEKNKATMNATKQQETETELQTMYQKIQQTFQDNQQALQKKSNDLMEPIITKIRNAIIAVGKAGAYTSIFEDGSVLYLGDNVKDVTAEVKAEVAKMKGPDTPRLPLPEATPHPQESASARFLSFSITPNAYHHEKVHSLRSVRRPVDNRVGTAL